MTGMMWFDESNYDLSAKVGKIAIIESRLVLKKHLILGVRDEGG